MAAKDAFAVSCLGIGKCAPLAVGLCTEEICKTAVSLHHFSTGGVDMDVSHAKELLEVLADGVNPLTGEVLARDDSCNQPDIIRALHVAVKQLEKGAKRARSLPENAGKPWTEEDERTLARMFDQHYSKKEICAYFKRTEGSIAARLVRMGKIQSRYEMYYRE